MKKLNLQLGSIKEMLTKEQMKKVDGGGYNCCPNIRCYWSFASDPTEYSYDCSVCSDDPIDHYSTCPQEAIQNGADSSVYCLKVYSTGGPC